MIQDNVDISLYIYNRAYSRMQFLFFSVNPTCEDIVVPTADFSLDVLG